MIPLGGLLLEGLPLLHQLVVRETDAVDPLQGLGLIITWISKKSSKKVLKFKFILALLPSQ